MSEEEIIWDAELISTLVMNGLIIIITIYLFILYIKSKEFHSYSCINILLLSLAIFLDNAIRLIPISSAEKYEVFRYMQAFFLVSLDKYIPLLLTGQIFLIYLAIMKTDFYYNHKKIIFLITFFFYLILCFLFGGLYLLFGLVKYGIYYYVNGEYTKQITDTIFNSIFLAFNTFFSVIIILNTALRKEDIEKGMLNESDYEHELYRVILLSFASSLMYIESYLIIWDKLPVPDNFIDLVFIVTCLIVNLIYAINKTVINVTKDIFCKKILNKKEPRANTYQTMSHESEMTSKVSTL